MINTIEDLRPGRENPKPSLVNETEKCVENYEKSLNYDGHNVDADGAQDVEDAEEEEEEEKDVQDMDDEEQRGHRDESGRDKKDSGQVFMSYEGTNGRTRSEFEGIRSDEVLFFDEHIIGSKFR